MPFCEQCDKEIIKNKTELPLTIKTSKIGNVLVPLQCNLSVYDYFELIKIYAVAMGKELNDDIIKIKFVSGLSSQNDIDSVLVFGIDNSIDKIIEHLVENEKLLLCE